MAIVFNELRESGNQNLWRLYLTNYANRVTPIHGNSHQISRRGRVILQAPAVFLIAIVIVTGIAWTATNWLNSNRISDLQSRLSLKDDQISDYKEKLNGATPDEAKKRLDALELQVKALSPRRLTNDQRDKIARVLGKTGGAIEIAQDMGVVDVRAYAGDFALAFRSAGWTVSLPSVMGIGNPPRTGIALRVENLASLRPAELIAKRALEAAEIGFDVQEWHRPPRSNFPIQARGIPIPQEPDVSLLLTTKLD